MMKMDHSQWTKIANDECEEYEISFFTKTVRDIRLSKKKKMTPFFMLRYLAIKRDVKCFCLGNDKVCFLCVYHNFRVLLILLV